MFQLSFVNKLITTMVIRLLDDYTLCSICVHSFGTLAKAVRLLMASLSANVFSNMPY